MSIHGIHGTATPQLPASSASDSGATGVAAARIRSTGDTDTATTAWIDGAADKPAPLRFPWLSRLSAQLSAASKTPTTFAAPILGDNLDKQA